MRWVNESFFILLIEQRNVIDVKLAGKEKRNERRAAGANGRSHEVVILDEAAAIGDVFCERSSSRYHAAAKNALGVLDRLILVIPFRPIELDELEKVRSVLGLV